MRKRLLRRRGIVSWWRRGSYATTLPIPDKVWEELLMDFIEGQPISHGFNSILVVFDCLTKYAHFLVLQHPFTAQMVADIITREIIKLHGFQKSIVSDTNKVFTRKFWSELFDGVLHTIPKLMTNWRWLIIP